jgi:hypothetical protein
VRLTLIDLRLFRDVVEVSGVKDENLHFAALQQALI